MDPISAEITIDVPREKVFALVSDLAARPSFTDHFLSDYRLTRIEATGVGAGARFRVQAPLRKVWMDTTIVELEAPHKVVEQGLGGRTNRIATRTVWELIEGPGPLTTVRVVHWTEPSSPVDRALEGLSSGSIWHERGWRKALKRLREMLESEASRPVRIGVGGGNRHATGVP